MTVVAAHQDPERERTIALRESVADVAPNVGGLSQEISELRHQGIEVDDDNDPEPDNAQPSVPSTQTIGQWVTPTICPRRADVNCHNTKGVWRQHSWPKISEMTEISIFRMEFTEKWVRGVLIPATNGDTFSWHFFRGSLTGDCGGPKNRYQFGKDPPSGCRST